MTNLLENYEQQYGVLTAEITAKISKLPNAIGGEWTAIVSEVERQMDEAHELLEQMELEIREVQTNVRPRLQTRLNSYRAELSRLGREFQKSRRPAVQEGMMRDELFGDTINSNEEQKRCLLDNAERLERTGNRLEAGYRVCIETEQLGSQILNDLHTQRETIQRSRARLRETDSDLDRSTRVLNTMMSRMMQHRVILFGVAAVMISVIVIGIYFSTTHGS